MRHIILAAAMILTGVTIGACNTMEGMGQDMKAGGAKLEKSADENKGPEARRYGE